MEAAAVESAFHRIRPDVIIHCAALTNVDACEAVPERAYQLNVQATETIANWIRQKAPNTQLIYVSSDQIYQGPGPHSETNAAPINTYALTKLWGEYIVREVDRHLILRTNFLGFDRNTKTGFVAFLLDAFEKGTPITLFRDVLFNPLYATDWPAIIWPLVDGKITGTYNLGASGNGISKAEFALQVAEALNLNTSSAIIGSVEDVSMAARRPNDMRMDISKIQECLSQALPTVEESLKRLITDYCEAK